MTTWIYKATESRIGYADTEALALSFSFLCRSLYTRPGATAARVRRVTLGDTILFYYRLSDKQRTVKAIGTFEVIDGSRLPGRFAGFAENTALVKVANSPSNATFLALLQKKPTVGAGYRPDPVLGVFTGWALSDLDRVPPPFTQDWMPNAQTTLCPYPGAKL